ncbi:MAG: 30S ribosomal protein S17 [Candidatus Marinimicrobia bacterium]|nr:30S ribosomal protein S17 [Candidatus Neomarinimicrobiota bacterium]|tara:strand:+ start:203 stop:472 length:270 start_codon:yes stop_codon:yes gene_type:complete
MEQIYKNKRRILEGIVVSDKMNKTVRVEVKRRVKHVVYKKYITKKKKFSADSGNYECSLGDKVKIVSCRPLSKTKRWRVIELLEKGIIS